VTNAARGTVVLLADGKEISSAKDLAVTGDDETKHVSWTSDGKRHWIRANVMGPYGEWWLVGNPVYVNW